MCVNVCVCVYIHVCVCARLHLWFLQVSGSSVCSTEVAFSIMSSLVTTTPSSASSLVKVSFRILDRPTCTCMWGKNTQRKIDQREHSGVCVRHHLQIYMYMYVVTTISL